MVIALTGQIPTLSLCSCHSNQAYNEPGGLHTKGVSGRNTVQNIYTHLTDTTRVCSEKQPLALFWLSFTWGNLDFIPGARVVVVVVFNNKRPVYSHVALQLSTLAPYMAYHTRIRIVFCKLFAHGFRIAAHYQWCLRPCCLFGALVMGKTCHALI
jgi:hypothetical protein